MSPLTVDEVQGRLREVLTRMQPGEEVILTDNGQPLAKLVREQTQPAVRPPPGLCRGMIISIAPDFDAPLEEMKEYME